MIRITKQTRLMPEDIIFKSDKFFGKQGEQLEEKERNPCCITFVGSGGYVSISIVEDGNRRTVDAETREFEYQVRRFLERL